MEIFEFAVGINFFATFAKFFATFVVKRDLLNRRGRKEGAKVAKNLPTVISRVAGLDGDEGSAAGGGGFAVGRDGCFDDGAVVC